jgi:hypothetical protein
VPLLGTTIENLEGKVIIAPPEFTFKEVYSKDICKTRCKLAHGKIGLLKIL